MTIVLATFAAVLVASPLLAALHIGLASSVPAKGAHLMTAPTEIRLTFTGPIDVKKAGIELVGSDSGLVPTAPLQGVADSIRVAVAKITGKLIGGTYTVKWRLSLPTVPQAPARSLSCTWHPTKRQRGWSAGSRNVLTTNQSSNQTPVSSRAAPSTPGDTGVPSCRALRSPRACECCRTSARFQVLFRCIV